MKPSIPHDVAQALKEALPPDLTHSDVRLRVDKYPDGAVVAHGTYRNGVRRMITIVTAPDQFPDDPSEPVDIPAREEDGWGMVEDA